jgi:hypothetical protein
MLPVPPLNDPDGHNMPPTENLGKRVLVIQRDRAAR